MRIAVIDSNFLCYRALHTTGGLSYKNRKTGIVFGFLQQILTIAGKTRPDSMVFAWDSRNSKRREIYPPYKNRRHKTTDPEMIAEMRENYRQFKLLRKVLIPELGFRDSYMFNGYEADDIMARIVMNKKYKGHDFVLVTGDDDMLQLLDFCEVYHPGKDEWKSKEWFMEEYGIKPKTWIKIKQIAGCTSDNVIGIKGVGEKKALKYITGQMNPKTVIYKRIESMEGQLVINENEALVKLPFHGTPPVSLSERPSKVNMKYLSRTCKELGIRRLLSPDKLDEWEAYFNGE